MKQTHFLSFQDDFNIPRNASIIDISWKALRIHANRLRIFLKRAWRRIPPRSRVFRILEMSSLTPASGRELVIDGSLKTPGLIQDGKNAGMEFSKASTTTIWEFLTVL